MIHNYKKYLVLILAIVWISAQAMPPCSYTINTTISQPTCGSNGLISYSLTPSPPSGAIFDIFKDGKLLVSVAGTIANLNSLAPGAYKVVVKDNASGCMDSTSEIVLSPSLTALSATYKMDSTRCDTSYGGKLTLRLTNANMPVTYAWSHSALEKDSIAENLTTGKYSVTIVDNSNCRFELLDMVVKEIQGKIWYNSIKVTPTSCDSPIGEIDVKYGGRHEPVLRWLMQLDTFTIPLDSLRDTMYAFIISDTLKCYDVLVKNIEVKKNPPPAAYLYGTDSICIENQGMMGVKITKGDSTQMTYKWYVATGVDASPWALLPMDSPSRYDLTAGYYKVEVRDRAGCIDTPKRRLNDYPPYNQPGYKYLKLTTNPTTGTIVSGQKIFVKLDTILDLYNLRWSDTTLVAIGKDKYLLDSHSFRSGLRGQIWAYPTYTTTYWMVANYGPGCELKLEKTVTVEAKTIKAMDTLVANIFSPNGDGKNEVYKLRESVNFLDAFEITIYDRWGNVVFKSFDAAFQWDGNHPTCGEPVQSGVYTYLIKYTTVDKPFDRQVMSGTILLER